jgi:hypothetical protein
MFKHYLTLKSFIFILVIENQSFSFAPRIWKKAQIYDYKYITKNQPFGIFEIPNKQIYEYMLEGLIIPSIDLHEQENLQ